MHRPDAAHGGLALYRPDDAASGGTTVDDAIRDATEFSIVVYGEDFTILSAAGGALAVNGLEPSTMVGTNAADMLPSWAWERFERPLRAALNGYPSTTLVPSEDGSSWFSINLSPIPGNVPRAVAVTTTVTGPQMITAEGRPASSENPEPWATSAVEYGDEVFEVAFEGATVGMALVDMKERWVRVNEAMSTFLGRSPQELGRMTFRELTESQAIEADEVRRLVGGEIPRVTVEQRYRHKDGHWVYGQLSVSILRDRSTIAQLFVVQIVDITARKSYEAKLERLAVEDALTGLANRRGIELALDAAVAEGRGTALLVDIDGFKHTNDGFGHSAGDAVLKAVASRLRDCTDADAIVGRIGGDEFAVVLPSGRPDDAEAIAVELTDWISATSVVVAPNTSVSPTVSIGAVIIDDGVQDSAAILLATDIAMYDAKDRGGNQAVLYAGDVTAHARASSDLHWLTELRRALTEHRFELHLQAIVDLQTGLPVKHEALLRLRSDDGTLLYPGAFMPAAERLKLMRDIDEWVVSEAAAYAAAYPQAVLSVNLSGSSVGDPGLADRIEQTLFLSQCNPAQMIFEITETEAIANLDQARELVDRLLAYGCQFALDDFGSGYASFSHLKKLPVASVKIDGQFVRDLATNSDDQLIVEAVHNVALGMDRTVVAEMIEDAETVVLLQAMGVEFGQGYHFAKPAPAEDVLAALPPATPRVVTEA